uniref:EGF-like domain-containing protein n=1 Tax=Kryptolebias marmoratus TaxID=37003 RepID=A0A3Q3GLC5_KRYMA
MWALLFHIIAVFVAAHVIQCQTVCSRQASLEWHPKKHTIQMNWTLTGNICRSRFECWGTLGEDKSSEQPFNFPQICPLQLQHGNELLMSADETLRSYGTRILSVSKDTFESCSTNGEFKKQFLFPYIINKSEQVEAKWIVPGHHYFIALHEEDAQLWVNCSEVVGKENCDRICENGTCVEMSPTSFKCICDNGSSGPLCKKKKALCDPNPCRNDGQCAETPKGFVCHCPDSQVDLDCASHSCQGERNCTAGEHVSGCVCADGTLVPECRRQQSMCSPSPCLN